MPLADSATVRLFIVAEPNSVIFPRRPPVPKGMISQNSASSSSNFPPATRGRILGTYAAYPGSLSQRRRLVAADSERRPASFAESTAANAESDSEPDEIPGSLMMLLSTVTHGRKRIQFNKSVAARRGTQRTAADDAVKEKNSPAASAQPGREL